LIVIAFPLQRVMVPLTLPQWYLCRVFKGANTLSQYVWPNRECTRHKRSATTSNPNSNPNSTSTSTRKEKTSARKGKKKVTTSTATEGGKEGGSTNTQPLPAAASTSVDKGTPGGSLEQEGVTEQRLREGPARNLCLNRFSVHAKNQEEM
ncbi:unnamed protein product, partial [Choristocarpus tenellus]